MAEIVVIGGSGFIGRHLVRRLVEGGAKVRVVSRSAGTIPGLPAVEYVTAAVGNAAEMLKALEGSREVYHLAAGGGASWADFERDFVAGAHNVAEACRQHGVRRLVYASSIAVLYLGDGGIITEVAGVDPKPAARSAYARAKIAAEGVLIGLHTETGFPVVIVRPGVVMGRGGLLTHSGIGMWPSDVCCMGWGGGEYPLPLVLADDVADAMIAAMKADGIEGRSFNLAGDVRPSAREFTRIMAEHSRRRIQFFPHSMPWLQGVEIMKWLIKAAARKQENPFPSWRDLKSRSLRTQLDCSAAKQLLGWAPVATLDPFIAAAIDSCIRPIQPGDLRQSSLPDRI